MRRTAVTVGVAALLLSSRRRSISVSLRRLAIRPPVGYPADGDVVRSRRPGCEPHSQFRPERWRLGPPRSDQARIDRRSAFSICAWDVELSARLRLGIDFAIKILFPSEYDVRGQFLQSVHAIKAVLGRAQTQSANVKSNAMPPQQDSKPLAAASCLSSRPSPTRPPVIQSRIADVIEAGVKISILMTCQRRPNP